MVTDRSSQRSAAGGTARYRLHFFLSCIGLVYANTSCDYLPSKRMTQYINMAQHKDRITREEALSFLLTYIVVEQNHHLVLDQLALFNLTNLALRAVEEMAGSEGIIPHEAIESLAKEYLDAL